MKPIPDPGSEGWHMSLLTHFPAGRGVDCGFIGSNPGYVRGVAYVFIDTFPDREGGGSWIYWK